jgi:hypothetical protein
MSGRLRNKVFITPEVNNLFNAVRTIDCQKEENGEVGKENDVVERVELIKRADVRPGFVNQVVIILCKNGVRTRPYRRWPRSWKRARLSLKKHN